MQPTYFLMTDQFPIYDQLVFEEGFLRTRDENLIWINRGSPPAIVLGISSAIEAMIDPSRLALNPIPVIRRYSGGGTVVVDSQTLFVTWIFNSEEQKIAPYPQAIMQWSEQFYRSTLHNLPFALKENDYVIGEKKFGGNAQYLTKKRFTHHSTLLWEYSKELMGLLKQPKKVPAYRFNRSHEDFLTCLSSYFQQVEEFLDPFQQTILKFFDCQRIDIDQLKTMIDRPFRQSTHFLDSLNSSRSDLLSSSDQKMLVESSLSPLRRSSRQEEFL